MQLQDRNIEVKKELLECRQVNKEGETLTSLAHERDYFRFENGSFKKELKEKDQAIDAMK